MLCDPGSALQRDRLANKKITLGVSLRLPSLAQGQVTFLHHASCPPKALKLVFLIWIFHIHGYSETMSLAWNSRWQ